MIHFIKSNPFMGMLLKIIFDSLLLCFLLSPFGYIIPKEVYDLSYDLGLF